MIKMTRKKELELSTAILKVMPLQQIISFLKAAPQRWMYECGSIFSASTTRLVVRSSCSFSASQTNLLIFCTFGYQFTRFIGENLF